MLIARALRLSTVETIRVFGPVFLRFFFEYVHNVCVCSTIKKPHYHLLTLDFKILVMADGKPTTLPGSANLSRSALNSAVPPVLIPNTSGLSLSTKTAVLGGGLTIPDLTRLRKQSNPIKQPCIMAMTMAEPPKSKLMIPQPPPLVEKQQQQQSTCSEHSYAAQPTLSNGGNSINPASEPKKEVELKSSSESSSEDSSSESSSSSGEESDKEEKPAQKFVQSSTTPQPASPAPARRGRGRPRKHPEPFTPRPPKASTNDLKTKKSLTTPRKTSSGRMLKPPELFTPNAPGMDGKNFPPKKRGRGCGACPGCLRDDCGKCSYCLDKTKFGGPGKKKQRCSLRLCSNFVRFFFQVFTNNINTYIYFFFCH